jgi:general secretion pathway protein E
MSAQLRSSAGKAGETFAPGKLRLNQVLSALIEDGLLGADVFNRVMADPRSTRALHPLVVLADMKLKGAQPPHRVLTLEVLTEWLAGRVGLPYVHIDPLRVDFTKVADIMSSQYATRFAILPIEIKPNEVVIACSEPVWTEWEAEIEKIMRRPIRKVVANPVDVARFIAEFYSLARSVKKASAGAASLHSNTFEQLVDLGRTGRQVDANDEGIIHIVDWLWQYAFEQRASDIHIEPRREQGIVRFRIDGVLHQVYQVPTPVMTAMVSRVKLLGRMDVVEKRRPQDGRIKTRHTNGDEVELRLSTLPTAFGEKLVMRIFDPDVIVKDFGELGFGDDDSQRWQQMTKKPNGIILVTGPTGSGKTTTLYSTLKQLATETVNVCTVEDPIEMVEPSFNQMQVQAGLELGFVDGLRALMRQDPDIIMVGEIRDLETAEMAIQAALTGHLVLSTLHTNDAPSAVTRLLELGVPYYLINATLLGVLAQRLVRTLCPHCKKPAAPLATDVWANLIAPWKTERVPGSYQPVGCLECRMTGYKGRIGLYELLVMNDELRSMIHAAPDLMQLRTKALAGGMRPLRLAGANKIAAGLTTIEEVLAATPSGI